MRLLRPFLIIFAFALWQGGFLFYVSFVVPVGTDVLGSGAEQGFITRRVTIALNGVGFITLAILATEQCHRRVLWRWVLWVMMLMIQIGLWYLHRIMDAYLDVDTHHIAERPQFYLLHRVYLWASTLLWVLALLWMWLTIRHWNILRINR